MGVENSGRGGLPPDVIEQVARLLAREEKLSDAVIAERAGCHPRTVRQFRRGNHWSQRDEDRRGDRPARIRLALEFLQREPRPSISRVARLLGMHRDTVRKLARGEYITQRDSRYAPIGGQVNRARPCHGLAVGQTDRNS
jgi:DNA-binding CsgD family transcriptional regulator